MQIPTKKVGLVIGKGSETIKNMQPSTGARIQVIPLHPPLGDTSTERIVQIDGTPDQIEAAKQMVNEVINGQWLLTARLSSSTTHKPGPSRSTNATVRLWLPSSWCISSGGSGYDYYGQQQSQVPAGSGPTDESSAYNYNQQTQGRVEMRRNVRPKEVLSGLWTLLLLATSKLNVF